VFFHNIFRFSNEKIGKQLRFFSSVNSNYFFYFQKNCIKKNITIIFIFLLVQFHILAIIFKKHRYTKIINQLIKWPQVPTSWGKNWNHHIWTNSFQHVPKTDHNIQNKNPGMYHPHRFSNQGSQSPNLTLSWLKYTL
jgi:hypothetical protein